MIRLYRFLKPFRLQIAGVLVLTLAQSISQLYLPTLTAHIVDTGIVHNDTNYIVRVGILMLVIAALAAVASVGATYLASRTAVAFGRNVRRMIFERVESFSLHEFDRIGTATLITRSTNDITQVQLVTMVILRMMVMSPLLMIGGLVMAFSQDRPLTLTFAVSVPALALIIALTLRYALPLFQVMQIKLDRVNLVLREGLTGIRVIRAFDRIEHEQRRFTAANLDLTQNSIQANRIMAINMPALMLVMNLTTLAIIWFGAIRIDNGDMQVGSLIAFIQYGMQIMFSVLMLSMMFVMIPRAAASADRINEVLDTVPSIVDAQQVRPSGMEHGVVEFDNVTFSYPGAEQPAICDISFRARPGEVTAIIGGTGSGKSTLVNLIPRFYDIDSGRILVDGVDVREMAQTDLRSKIGFVPQKTVLFTGTVAENIRYGKDDATDDEITHAAVSAQAVDFITAMAEGFDSPIAQGGTNLSGGQKQRLSIARALVRRPEIYIFDDSFSALDFKTDARLRAALKRETVDSTVLIIAQRVATVMDADRIIVLDDGRIAGMGTHRELMRSSQVYREIVASQLSDEEAA